MVGFSLRAEIDLYDKIQPELQIPVEQMLCRAPSNNFCLPDRCELCWLPKACDSIMKTDIPQRMQETWQKWKYETTTEDTVGIEYEINIFCNTTKKFGICTFSFPSPPEQWFFCFVLFLGGGVLNNTLSSGVCFTSGKAKWVGIISNVGVPGLVYWMWTIVKFKRIMEVRLYF